ncbi:MAG: hypothetical protein EZS28_048092, partial [Streblomastix strix]
MEPNIQASIQRKGHL